MRVNIQKSFLASVSAFTLIAVTALQSCAPRYGCHYGMTTPQISVQDGVVMTPDVEIADAYHACAE